MIEFSEVVLKRLTEAYAIANTPEFLLRRLVADDSVKTIADSHSASEIACSMKEILDLESQTISSIVSCYALLAALTFKDLQEAQRAIETIQLQKLQWAEHIWRHHIRRHINTTIITRPGYSNIPIEPLRSETPTANIILTSPEPRR